MNIRPKMIPMFQNGKKMPSTVTWTNPNSTWFTRSGNNILEGTYNYIKPFYDKWKSSGKLEDYLAYKKAVDALNSDLRYGYAPGHLRYLSGNNQLFKDDSVGAWLNIVRRNYNYINDSLGKNINLYHVESSNPYSGDNLSLGWKVDKLWAGETDDRTTWGNLLNENDSEYLKWKLKFSEIGIDYRTNPEWNTGNVLYGFLKDPKDSSDTLPLEIVKKSTKIIPNETKDKESLLSKLSGGIKNIAPDLLDAIRLAGNMHNNEKVYQESMKGIQPNIQTGYTTHRQIVGDEATKQAFYKRAAQGLWKASRPVTSDLDRQMAYIHEAGKAANELKEQGDLADNQEIRRTTDESNQHQWANTQRNTEIANNNLTELIKANAAKHQLTAQKYSVDWTNLEQFLMGKQSQFNQEKAEQKLLDRLKQALANLQLLLNDNNLTSLKSAAEKAYDEYYKDSTNTLKKEDYEKKRKEYLNYYYSLQLQILDRTRLAKLGAKIERKYKDETLKYLYKTSRDLAEHFRKIVKMTDDSRIRTIPKPIKLSSHPRKMLLGGVAPFTVYRPLGVGGESAVSTQATSSASSDKKSDAAKDKLDMIKELFKSVQGLGLPIDVSQVYTEIQNLLGKAKAFGEELSTDDIASMYLSSMNKINNLKYSKEVFDKAKALATANEALNEYAVTVGGNLILQNQEDGSIKIGTYQEMEASLGKYNALTNDLLLNLRAYSPDMVLAKGDELMLIVNNGVGMNKIAAQIKAMATSIGSMEQKIEGISQIESNKIKAGLQILAGTDGTPDGYYKVSTDVKDSRANIQKALDYIYGMLPNNYRTLLEIHSGGKGKDLIGKFLAAQTNDFEKQEISPLTGQASDKDKTDKGIGGDMIPAVAFFQGLGEKETFVIQDKTADGLKINTISAPITSKGANTGTITLEGLIKSDFGGQLNINLATMGDSLIASNGRNNVIIGDRIYQTELPIDLQAKALGIIKPDLNFLKKIEEADLKLKNAGIDKNDPKNVDKINLIYKSCNLPIIYTKDGNGLPTLTGEYARFAMVNATATEDAFGENPEFNDGVVKAETKERQLFELMMLTITNNSKYKLSSGFAGIGGTDLYKGIIYIPMVTNTISALGGTGYKGTSAEYNQIEALQQSADNARLMGYNPVGGWK